MSNTAKFTDVELKLGIVVTENYIPNYFSKVKHCAKYFIIISKLINQRKQKTTPAIVFSFSFFFAQQTFKDTSVFKQKAACTVIEICLIIVS